MAVEKEIEKTESAPQPNAVFDDSSNFLIYATLLGIKVSSSLTGLPPLHFLQLYFFFKNNLTFLHCLLMQCGY